MLRSLIIMELYKIRKTNILFLIFLSPLLSALIGMYVSDITGGNKWTFLLAVMTPMHSLLLLPLLIGVFSSFICRYEHLNGGWKQLLSLPVKRHQVYLAKFTVIIFIIALNQLLFAGCWMAIGFGKGFTDSMPLDIAAKCLLGGWIACLPLSAIMLWVSMAWSSFAAPLTLNVIFTLPNILVANSEHYAPYYPWVQPFLTMMPKAGGPWGGFFISFESIVFAITGSFIIFFAGGLLYIRRKAV